MKLLVAIPLCAADLPLCASLIDVLARFGPYEGHPVLFAADRALTKQQFEPLLRAAQPLFAQGEIIMTPMDLPDTSFPRAHNFRFETAARHIGTLRKTPFLWLDPRCVPMRIGWLRDIEEEYFSRHRPFMGHVLTPEANGTAQPILAAPAVYPSNLPKRMFQYLVAQRHVEWEKSCAGETAPNAHPSALIRCIPRDVPLNFGKLPGAALIHTQEARALADRILGRNAQRPAKPVASEVKPATLPPSPPAPAIPTPAKSAALAVDPAKPLSLKVPTSVSNRAYYHSGDLGDIIYALAAIRLAGGGKLILGPRQKRTPSAADPIKKPKFDLLEPLLSAQPYLSKVQYTDRYPGTDTALDLNSFRTHWTDPAYRDRTGIHNLARMHCHLLGVAEQFHPKQSWISYTNPISTGYYVIHRSARWHAIATDQFPWPLILQTFAGRLLFIGLPQEHADFQHDFKCRVAFWRCTDFLEMANVIAGALGFIGNQSFPMAMAVGLGQRILQESCATSPDCQFPRHNFRTQPLTKAELDPWARSTLTTPGRDGTMHPRVTTRPSPRTGLIELGPCADAQGLGDTLTITPLAARLGSRAVMLLPKSMTNYAPLFDGLCPVQESENHPVFHHPAGQRYIEAKLRMFGFECEDGKTLPVVKLHLDESKPSVPGEVIFSTACAKRWVHLRSRPSEWFEPILDALRAADRTATEFSPDAPLRETAARFQAIGRYIGTNSGPWHLAMAMGCKCLVLDADECHDYRPAEWRYNLPTVRYVPFDQDAVIAAIPWLLA